MAPCYIQSFLEHLQGWWLHHIPGQSIPILNNTFWEEISLDVQLEPPLALPEVMFSHPTAPQCLVVRGLTWAQDSRCDHSHRCRTHHFLFYNLLFDVWFLWLLEWDSPDTFSYCFRSTVVYHTVQMFWQSVFNGNFLHYFYKSVNLYLLKKYRFSVGEHI